MLRPTIVGAVLARNEADRWLRRTLENCRALCDHVILLDDGSTDATPDVARELGAEVITLTGDGFWGKAEAPARLKLWEAAGALAGPEGWVYISDADHELLGVTQDDLRALSRAQHVNAWAWPLYDCWDSDQQHRVDGFWQAHRFPRPWMARAFPEPGFSPVWTRQGLHVGHFPENYPWQIGTAPGWIRHLGYVNLADRELKARRYLDQTGAAV